MDKLKELWATPKGRAGIKLGIYFLFLLLIVIIAKFNTNNNISSEDIHNLPIVTDKCKYEQVLKNIVNSPKYDYTLELSIMDNEQTNIYTYFITTNGNKKTIFLKDSNNNNINEYYYEQGNYYQKNDNNYVLTSKKQIYNIEDDNYLDLNNIMLFLTKANEEDECNYTIPISSIILNSDSTYNISIRLSDSQIDIDYGNVLLGKDITVMYTFAS